MILGDKPLIFEVLLSQRGAKYNMLHDNEHIIHINPLQAIY
jgi:hypothetical protein